MMKKTILSEPNREMPIHSHLEEVINCLLEAGNELSLGFRWGSNREGFYCYLSKPIDFDLLEDKFEFPNTISLVRQRNVIFCKATGCLIETKE